MSIIVSRKTKRIRIRKKRMRSERNQQWPTSVYSYMWHSKETVAEKNGARLVGGGGIVWNRTSKRRKRESEGNEIILRDKESLEVACSRKV